jgi:hypothetical protein
MTPYQFNLLSDGEQTAKVWSEGIFVEYRDHEAFRIELYLLDSFYVEVFYNSKTNQIVKIHSFLTTNNSEPYLGQIDISGLIF